MGDVVRPRRVDETAVSERRRKVAALYLRHHTQETIARQLGVNQATVSLDLKALREQWKAESVSDIGERVERESQELDEMEREAVLMFAQEKTPEWFDRRLKVKQRRAALLGLDAPQRAEIAGPGGGPIPMFSEVIVELPRPQEEPVSAIADTPELPPAEEDATPGNSAALEIVVDLP